MKRIFNSLKELQGFLALWGSQSLSSLGSSMTSFALIIWAYGQSGSALTTALLSVCSYTPYVLLSVFAGVAGDRLSKKRTMLVCDSTAAITTCLVWLLMISGRLAIWHLYVINAVSGVMNALQQPASEVTVTMLTPAKYYQRVGGLRAFSNSLVTLLAPVLATAVLGFWGIGAVIFFDLASFLFAFVTLVCFIRMDESSLAAGRADRESFLASAGQGIGFLRANRGILGLILFLGSLGTLFWRACLESDPVLRQHDHTVHDERNTAIRGKASAKTLEILRVVLMAAVVWAAAGDSSRQLAVLLFGILLLLSGVEFGCTLYYRRKM